MKLPMKRSKIGSLAGLWFGLLTLLLNEWAHFRPTFVEHWYSRGLFQWVRGGFDHTLGQLPFPSFYLFWLGVLCCAIWAFRRRPAGQGFWVKTRYWVVRLLNFSGWLVGAFFWLWAFNYARIPLHEQMKLDVQPLDSATIWRELRLETRVLDSLRNELVDTDTNALNDERFWPKNAEDSVRASVEKWLAGANFPVNGAVRGRFIYPKGTLFSFGASGIYWPFIGEGNLEAGMHALRKLPAMAHEMSHGYGFCDEGVCNFLAYVACTEQPNTYLAYCARLDYWSTVANACLENDPLRYQTEFRPRIPPGIAADVRAIRKQNLQYQELAPAIRYEVYDAYLKAQGIKSGMLNYDEVLMLVVAYRKKQ